MFVLYRKRKTFLTRIAVVAGLIVGSLNLSAQSADTIPTIDTTVYHYSQLFSELYTMPVFPGLIDNWIYHQLEYPKAAREKGIEGQVYVRFIIEKDGSVSSPEIIRGVAPELDEEALKITGIMPRWTPGKKEGLPIRVSLTVPVYFSLKSRPVSLGQLTMDQYAKFLRDEEARLNLPPDSLAEANSVRVYRSYLYRRYGSDKTAYTNILSAARDEQQSDEISLGITLPRLNLSPEEKNKILTFYKNNWEERIRLIDSISGEHFIHEYAKLSSLFSDNIIRRELNIRDYLGAQKFRRYVDGCIIQPGKLIRSIIANPLAGKWEKVYAPSETVQPAIYKEFMDDYRFSCSDGVSGNYKLASGHTFTEHAETVRQKEVLSYTAHYQYRLNGIILNITGERQLKLADGTIRNETIQETWRRID